MMLSFSNLYSFFGFTLFLVIAAILIVGLVQCKKHSFMPGFYFFAIMMISQIYSWISPYFTRIFLENRMSSFRVNPGDMMSIGQWVSVLALIPRVIEVIALAILVFGLYRMWSERHITSVDESME